MIETQADFFEAEIATTGIEYLYMETVRMDKVNQALAMFGMEAVPGREDKER